MPEYVSDTGYCSAENTTTADGTEHPCCPARAELNLLARRLGHDLRAPLRALNMLPQWIREDLTANGATIPPKAKEYLTMIERRAERMDNFLVAVLEYSKVAVADAQMSDIDPKREFDTALGDLAPTASCSVEIASDITGFQIAKSDFATLARHLISNAMLHNDHHDCQIDVRAERRDGQVIFDVRDNGPGIAAKDKARIFEPFVTLKPRDEVESSGLGLATVEKILTHWGGVISVHDAPGRGTVFRFRLPIITAADTNSGAGRSPGN